MPAASLAHPSLWDIASSLRCPTSIELGRADLLRRARFNPLKGLDHVAGTARRPCAPPVAPLDQLCGRTSQVESTPGLSTPVVVHRSDDRSIFTLDMAHQAGIWQPYLDR